MPRAGEDNIGYLLNQSARLLAKVLATPLKELGLTQGQYALIRSVHSMCGRPVTAAEVGDDLRLETSAVSHAVERAVTNGWLEAKPDPEHGRARVLELAPKATAALPVMFDAGRWTLEMGLNGFTHEEIAQLKAYLRRIVRNLEQADA